LRPALDVGATSALFAPFSRTYAMP
jgi:hypothetical protein